jgi:hypothetical protein
MKPGAIVKLLIPPMDHVEKKGSVDRGALARIVCGPDEFPYLYKKLEEQLGDCAQMFIWIKWMQNDPRWHGRIDGAYAESRFCEIGKRMINSNRVLN